MDRDQAPDVVLDALAAYREGIIRGDYSAVRLAARGRRWLRDLDVHPTILRALDDRLGQVVDALSRIPTHDAEALRAIEECGAYWRHIRGL